MGSSEIPTLPRRLKSLRSELVGPIDVHLAALRGDRTEPVIQALLCEQTELADREVARATTVPREYGLADVSDLTTRVDALELDKDDCP